MALRTSSELTRRCKTLCLGTLLLLGGCGQRRNLDFVVLSYAEESSFCTGCPRFRVELRRGGHVNLFGLSGCAIPGEHHYTIPEADFYTLLREFDRARFFSTPRLDPQYGGVDALVKRIGYRDETKIHGVVDGGRPLPAISGLEQTIRRLTKLDYYLTPSVNLYRDLIQSGWNVNTLGQDHENALLPAVYANDVASVAILLEHGAIVSGRALESAVDSKSIDIFRRLATAKKLDYQSEEGGRLVIAAASSGNMSLVRDLLDRGAPVDYRQPQSQETALLAAGPEYTEISHLLIERGADVNARDWMGRTPLFRAASGVNTAMIDLLAASGADMNIADNTGRTALMTASDLCWYWNIKAFLAHGADPMIRDHRGRTALEPNYVSPSDPKCDICRQLLKQSISGSH